MKIHVSNIDRSTPEEDLHRLFEEFGEVYQIDLNEEPDPDVDTFSAVVEMEYDSDAQEAIRELDGEIIDGRILAVRKFDPSLHQENQKSNRNWSDFDGLEEEDNSRWEPIVRKKPRSEGAAPAKPRSSKKRRSK